MDSEKIATAILSAAIQSNRRLAFTANGENESDTPLTPKNMVDEYNLILNAIKKSKNEPYSDGSVMG